MVEIDPALERAIEKAVEAGVSRALFDIGLNHTDNQQILEHRKDMTFLREQRITCEQIKRKGLWYSLSLLILGTVGILVIGIKGFLNAP